MSYFDLNLDLSPEDEAIKDAARRFALEVLRPASIVIDKLPAADVVAPESPLWTCLAQAYELGYHKAAMPEEVGGLGFTPLQSHILMEEIFYGSAGLGAALLLAAWPYVKLLHTGNPDLIKEFVIPFCNCTDASITGAWAITEPDHGSDTLNVGADFWTDPKVKLQLTATADGDEWVLSGQKSAWVSCGPTATQAMVNVQIDTSKGPSGGGVCMLPLDLAGIKRGSPLEKHGVRDLPQGEIFFDEVRIPRDWMFVEPAGYGDWVLGNLGFGNTAVAVLAVAIARAALDETLAYTKARIQGGKPLIEHHPVQVRVHRMFAQVEAIRAMSRAVWEVNARVYPPLSEYAYAAKTFCTEAAKDVVDEGVQLHGANGVTKEYYIEKLWRDARTMTIADGENSILNRMGGQILNETYPRSAVNQIA
ncbi:MAG TPA: acyl-CoA dehydrogenase family protein [Gammaproteobacteria bacterium]|jgi:alkylation response protein AidB-like acyl-CoA dehydrogenase|nr:acyl-CoA dehydrogenase family protein [Gammaproteobacteria bacterium]